MRISLGSIKTGVMASAIALSTTSCKDRSIANRTKDDALKYIPQLGIVDAERTGAFYAATGTHTELAGKVAYWDSIKSEALVSNAFSAGKEYALKKHNGDKNAKPKIYSQNLYNREIDKNGLNILNNLRNFNTLRLSSREWLRLRGNEPDFDMNSASTPSEIIFWNELKTTKKCKEAFRDGVKFVQDSLKGFIKNIPAGETLDSVIHIKKYPKNPRRKVLKY